MSRSNQGHRSELPGPEDQGQSSAETGSRGNRSIEPAGRRLSAVPTVQTAGGPATIQIIDMGGAGLIPAGGGGGAGGGKPGGINILGAVLRRWWLVLLVAVVVGGGGGILAHRFVNPAYEAYATVLYHPVIAAAGSRFPANTDPSDIVRTHMELLTKPEISLLAARDPELQQALPYLKGVDLENPAVQREVARKLRGICEALRIKDTELVQIYTSQKDGFTAAAVANAFADAFVKHCSERLLGRDGVRRKELEKQVASLEAYMNELVRRKTKLMTDNDFELQARNKDHTIAQIQKYQELKNEADLKRIAALADVERLTKTAGNPEQLPARFQLERKKRIEEEQLKDAVLQALTEVQMNAHRNMMAERAAGKLDGHRDVVIAKAHLEAATAKVRDRMGEIAGIIDKKIAEEQRLTVLNDWEQAQARLSDLEKQVAGYETAMAAMGKEARRLAAEQEKLNQIEVEYKRVSKQYDDIWAQYNNINVDANSQGDALILVAERAETPTTPSDDKRMKVQAASVVGGLLLGILLALVADKLDPRLRHPRDIEPLLGAPMLGMIPRIDELKRIKGDQARALIAEEFRLIRTQLLFNVPSAQHRVICVTSPAPGDGKTSLAVNLAISLAKAGRRVLLTDADLRKPDVHRIFQTPEAPGFSELIQGTADATSAIRHSDIENLDILPAGHQGYRPCEILSRPETPQVLDLLAELYDHVILDTAPLLPVSDTHVLLPLADGIICSFDAQVDRAAVTEMEAILKRSRTPVIGSVVNQVKYRQSGAYQRSRSTYGSYYTTPASTDPAPRSEPPNAAIATLDHDPDQHLQA